MRWLGFVAVACALLFGSGCGAGPGSRLVGKWEADAGGAKVGAEFAADGKLTMTIFGQSLPGTYRVVGDDLELTVSGQTSTAKYKVTGSELRMTRDGVTVKYRRV